MSYPTDPSSSSQPPSYSVNPYAQPPPSNRRRLSSPTASSRRLPTQSSSSAYPPAPYPTRQSSKLPLHSSSPASSRSASPYGGLSDGGDDDTWDELVPIPGSRRGKKGRWEAYRRMGSLAVVVLFVVSVSWMGLVGESTRVGRGMELSLMDSAQVGDIGQLKHEGQGKEDEGDVMKFDFEKYRWLETIEEDQLALDKKGRRLIIIGDIHGSIKPLHKLLSKVSYTPSSDTFLHVGDLIAKGPSPNAVLSYLNSLGEHGVRGVRGNHDQPVIAWRAWMNEVMRRSGKGKGKSKGGKGESVEDFFAKGEWTEKEAQKKWGFPEGWKWGKEHWTIARGMSEEDYEYLVSLPLQLHLPSLHSIIVHAGLLPFDPLQELGLLSDNSSSIVNATSSSHTPYWKRPDISRKEAELSILSGDDIPENHDAWTLINMRSILDDGEVTKDGNEGEEWSKTWNEEMKACKGASWTADDDAEVEGQEEAAVEEELVDESEGGEIETSKKKHKGGKKWKHKKPKPSACSPISVIYGHAAGRGLDIHPYSFGLDSGCVYGRQLTALVLGDLSGLNKYPSTKVGEMEGKLVSIDCPQYA